MTDIEWLRSLAQQGADRVHFALYRDPLLGTLLPPDGTEATLTRLGLIRYERTDDFCRVYAIEHRALRAALAAEAA